MNDLISRQALIEEIEQHKTAVLGEREWEEGIAWGYAAAHRHLVDIVKQLPSAQPEGCPFYIRNIHDRGDDSLCRLFHREVKCLAVETRQVGRWIKHISDIYPADSTIECSVCHAEQALMCDENFCPNCGAKMEADNET